MKTENEILTEIDTALCLSTFQMRKLELFRLFQEQRLDSKRAGMTEAADKLDEVTAAGEDSYSMRESCQQAILSARDNLKEI